MIMKWAFLLGCARSLLEVFLMLTTCVVKLTWMFCEQGARVGFNKAIIDAETATQNAYTQAKADLEKWWNTARKGSAKAEL